MRKLLVDTCAIIWLATGDRKLSQLARDAMRDAELLCFSSISIWEIARLVKAGDLEIPVTPVRLADMLVERYDMKELPINNSIALRSSALPEIHKDPTDRFIIATALLNDFTVVTGDRRFAEYGVETIN